MILAIICYCQISVALIRACPGTDQGIVIVMSIVIIVTPIKFLFLSPEYARALTKDKKFKEALSVISLCCQVIMVTLMTIRMTLLMTFYSDTLGDTDNDTVDDTYDDTAK